jgi:hypothetical protein
MTFSERPDTSERSIAKIASFAAIPSSMVVSIGDPVMMLLMKLRAIQAGAELFTPFGWPSSTPRVL